MECAEGLHLDRSPKAITPSRPQITWSSLHLVAAHIHTSSHSLSLSHHLFCSTHSNVHGLETFLSVINGPCSFVSPFLRFTSTSNSGRIAGDNIDRQVISRGKEGTWRLKFSSADRTNNNIARRARRRGILGNSPRPPSTTSCSSGYASDGTSILRLRVRTTSSTLCM